MASWSWVALSLLAMLACGDVPHPPARVLEKPIDFSDAGAMDASMNDGPPSDASLDQDAPKGPLPISSNCIVCGATPCFDVGARCAGDAFCQTCLDDLLAPGCLENRLVLDLGRCACTSSCYGACREVCEATRWAWDVPQPESGP
jgi:hypothetical protein